MHLTKLGSGPQKFMPQLIFWSVKCNTVLCCLCSDSYISLSLYRTSKATKEVTEDKRGLLYDRICLASILTMAIKQRGLCMLITSLRWQVLAQDEEWHDSCLVCIRLMACFHSSSLAYGPFAEMAVLPKTTVPVLVGGHRRKMCALLMSFQ